MNNSTYSLLGLNGKMMHCGQSLTISGGKITEDIVFNSIIENKEFKNIKTLSRKINKNKGIQLNFDDIFEKMDIEQKYVGQKVSITDGIKTIDVDLLIYINHVFYILEIKSSSNFDTKKIVGEVDSLFKSSIHFQKKMLKSNKTRDILVKPYFCAIDAVDENEVVKGAKGNIFKNDDFEKDGMIQDVIDYYKKININISSDFSDFIKNILEKQDSFISNDYPNIIENSNIKKLYVQPISGKQLFENILSIEFNELKDKREKELFDMYPFILEKKVKKKIITESESELFILIFNTLRLFDKDDIKINDFKYEFKKLLEKTLNENDNKIIKEKT